MVLSFDAVAGVNSSSVVPEPWIGRDSFFASWSMAPTVGDRHAQE
jgi:hypothetical protein